MKVEEFIERCFQRYQLKNWWPGSSFEIALSAILVQSTSWSGAWKALLQLREKGLTDDPSRLVTVNTEKLQKLIKSAGFYQRKSMAIKSLAHLWVQKGKTLHRDDLLAINGIGEETADAIILYACDSPTIPIDNYTKRIWSRVPLTPGNPRKNESLRKTLILTAKSDVVTLKKIHAAFVEFGKEFCSKKPRCHECFIQKCCKTGMKKQGVESHDSFNRIC